LVSAIFVGGMAVDEYFALYLIKVNIPSVFVGYLFAVYSLIQAFGSHIAYRFDSNKNLFVLLVIFSISIFTIGFTVNYLGVIIFISLAFVSSIGQVISNSAIQHSTVGQARATVSSVASFLAEIIAFFAYIIIWAVPTGDLTTGLIIYGLFIILITLVAIVLYLFKHKLIPNP
jgi:hypothetical protein